MAALVMQSLGCEVAALNTVNFSMLCSNHGPGSISAFVWIFDSRHR